MIEVANIIAGIARDAWAAFAVVLILIVVLGLLVRVLQGAGSMAIGGSQMSAAAVAGVGGLVALALVALTVVPAIAEAAYATAVSAAGESCGTMSAEVGDLGVASAMLIGVIGGLRMLKAAVEGTAYTAIGASGGLAHVLTIVVEALVGMALAPAAVPVAAAFLGC